MRAGHKAIKRSFPEKFRAGKHGIEYGNKGSVLLPGRISSSSGIKRMGPIRPPTRLDLSAASMNKMKKDLAKRAKTNTRNYYRTMEGIDRVNLESQMRRHKARRRRRK